VHNFKYLDADELIDSRIRVHVSGDPRDVLSGREP
jgi:hypothetical protein